MSGNMEKVLRLMAEKHASDVYLSANMPILIKIHGQVLQLSDQVLTPQQPRLLLSELLTPRQLEELDDTGGRVHMADGVCRGQTRAGARGRQEPHGRHAGCRYGDCSERADRRGLRLGGRALHGHQRGGRGGRCR